MCVCYLSFSPHWTMQGRRGRSQAGNVTIKLISSRMRSARHHNHKFPSDGFRFPSCSDRLTFIRRHHQVNRLMCSMSFMLWCSEQFFSRFLFQRNISKILRQKHFLNFFSTCATEWKNNFFLSLFFLFFYCLKQSNKVCQGREKQFIVWKYLFKFFFFYLSENCWTKWEHFEEFI